MLVITNSMFVPICNSFHTKRANNDIITFKGYPYLTRSFEGNSRIQGPEILSRKTRVLGAAVIKIS